MDLTTIRTDARYHISPQLTSTEYPDAALNRNLNRWYREIAGWIIPIQGEWELRGDILYRDLLVGVTDYEVPQKFFRIYKAEAMYTTGGSFVPVQMISVQANQASVEGNSTRTFDDASQPTGELFGDFLQLRPAPTEEVENGLKIWAQIDFEDLIDDSDVPDFLEPVARALSLGGAMDFALSEEMYTKYRELKKRMYGDPAVVDDKGLKGIVEELYSIRAGARRDQLGARRRSYR